jgi:hypothetical protein
MQSLRLDDSTVRDGIVGNFNDFSNDKNRIKIEINTNLFIFDFSQNNNKK